MAIYPGSAATTGNLYDARNNANTTLNGAISDSATTITVVSTTLFPSTGLVSIENEVISYTGKTGTTFTGCTRGFDGTTAVAHADGLAARLDVVARHHNILAEELAAVESDLVAGLPESRGGTGETTYTNGQVLIGKTDGTLAKSTLTAGTNISITNGDGSITIDSTASGVSIGDAVGSSTANSVLFVDGSNNLAESTSLTWDEGSTTLNVAGTATIGTGQITNLEASTSFYQAKQTETGTSASLVPGGRHESDNAALVTFTLPVTAADGQRIWVYGKGAGGWKIAQNSGQSIVFLSSTTTSGTGGYLQSSNRYDCVELEALDNTTNSWRVNFATGNITVI